MGFHILVSSGKGGVGKTTFLVELAKQLSERYQTALVEVQQRRGSREGRKRGNEDKEVAGEDNRGEVWLDWW